jgi:hypothetical protein
MNILEQDVIRREQANQNNYDVEKGEAVVPPAGSSLHAVLRALVLPAICLLDMTIIRNSTV